MSYLIGSIDVRILLMVAIALIYALFDTFNKRNIPNVVAYASVAIAFVVTLTYGMPIAAFSIALAVAIGAISFLLYRSGQLGAGDGYEFVALSLLVPIQPAPLLSWISNASQFGLPFIVSIFVASGVLTLIGVPIYYLLIRRGTLYKNPKWKKQLRINTQDIMKAASVIIMYAIFYLLLNYLIGVGLPGLIVVILIAVPSSMVLLFNKRINLAMVSMKQPSKLEDGDLIAVNLMTDSEISYFRKMYKGFGRLANTAQISKIKKSKKPLPVYSEAVPLALPIFFGVLVALLFGNLLLLII